MHLQREILMPVINLEKQNKDIKIKISVRMNGMVHRL